MRRSTTDVLRRGFENTVANWPLLMIRIAEGVLMFLIIVAAILAAIVPIAVSLGLNTFTADNPADAAEFLLGILADQWLLILYVIAVATAVLFVLVAIHSAVEAGSARVYIDAERATAAIPNAQRAHFRVFSGERWWNGAKEDWWSIFWIYNLAWAIAGLIILIPFLVLIALMLVFRENQPVIVGVACLGLALSFLFMLVVAVVTNIWCQKAIVVCVARTHRATGALSDAWREFRADAGRHIAVAVILFILMIVGSMMFASISFVGGMNDSPTFALAMLPMQLFGSVANTVFSAMIGAWFLACFASLSVESR